MTTTHLRTLRLTEHLIGFYDGRVPGQTFAEGPNWVDDGALELGVCSYALVDGDEALVYDTHISVPHAAAVRAAVEGLGATPDHRRAQPLAPRPHRRHRGLRRLRDRRQRAHGRAPGRAPRGDRGRHARAGRRRSRRSCCRRGRSRGAPGSRSAAWPSTSSSSTSTAATPPSCTFPATGLLLAGDTLEDTVTYVSEPEGLATHLDELERMRGLGATASTRTTASPEVIAGGGYAETLITATAAVRRGAPAPRPRSAARATPTCARSSQGRSQPGG